MATSTGRLSGLTTRGRCLLAGGGATAVCAMILDERDLLRVGVFVALLPLMALLLTARARRTVRAERVLQPTRAPVGSSVTAELRLSGAPLLGAMRMTDKVPDAVGPLARTPPRFTVHRLSSRGTAEVTYPLRPRLRGAHKVGPLTGTATDPLGLAEFAQELAGPDRMLVLPRIVKLKGLPPALGTGGERPGAAAARQGHGAPDVLIRQYRHGDEMRRVNWRSSARHDELMVRMEEQPWRGGITLMIDRRASAHRGRGPDASLEFAVSLTASIAVHLRQGGEPLSVLGEDGSPIGQQGGGRDTLLDAFAALRPASRTRLDGPPLPPGTAVLAVLGALSPGDVPALISRHHGRGHAILLDTPTWSPADRRAGEPDPTTGAASALYQAGWQVTVAAKGTDPAQAWEELVRSANDATQVMGS